MLATCVRSIYDECGNTRQDCTLAALFGSYTCGANPSPSSTFFFFNDPAPPEIYTLSLHDALPIYAVVYPLEQATIAPKITSTVKHFLVQRGSRVKKGQLLAELENKDLEAAAQASKGDFQQADATYKTTVGASLPQQIQRAELDAATAKSAFDAQQKVYDSRKTLFQQGAIPRRSEEHTSEL